MYPSFLPSSSRDGISLVSSGGPRTHAVGQAGLELTDPPAFASHVLGFRPVPSEQVFFVVVVCCFASFEAGRVCWVSLAGLEFAA